MGFFVSLWWAGFDRVKASEHSFDKTHCLSQIAYRIARGYNKNEAYNK